MRKGEQTRVSILAAALELAGRCGLEGLTLGALAERMQMSKSGVFAHFGSREELQIAVLQEYERRFVTEVLAPALPAPRGLPRLREICARWIDRTAFEAVSGCLWIGGATEYDDRPGAVREELVRTVRLWQGELSRAIRQAVETGELAPTVDVDELVFQLYGVVLVLHHDRRLLGSRDALPRARRSFERLIDSYRAPGATNITAQGTAPTTATPANLRNDERRAPRGSAAHASTATTDIGRRPNPGQE